MPPARPGHDVSHPHPAAGHGVPRAAGPGRRRRAPGRRHAARMTILDDDAATIRQAIAPRPDGTPGLRVTDGLYQTPTLPGVLPATRRVARARATGDAAAPGLVGLGARGMADLLADRMLATRSRRVLVDDLDTAFRGQRGRRPGGGARHPRPPGARPRASTSRCPTPASLLTDPAMAGARTAAMRAGGVWMDTTRWTPAGWLTWPSEMAYRLATGGSARARAHVSIGGGDQAVPWNRARAGSACPVLANGPGAVRLGASVDAFTAQYRWTFPVDQGPKCPPPRSARACPSSPPRAPARWTRRPRTRRPGLEIPPGGLVTPPVAAGVPAQVTLQLGARPAGPRRRPRPRRRTPSGPRPGRRSRRAARASRSPPRWPATGRRPCSSPPPRPGGSRCAWWSRA